MYICMIFEKERGGNEAGNKNTKFTTKKKRDYRNGWGEKKGWAVGRFSGYVMLNALSWNLY